MFMAGPAALVVLYLLLITPVRAGIILRASDGRELEGAAGVMLWGVRFQGRIGLVRNAAGKRRLYIGRTPPLPGEMPAAPAPDAAGILRWIRAVRRANRGRTLVKNAVSLDRLELDARIPGPDAAAAALLTGGARILGGLIPRLRLRAEPAYSGKGAFSFRCMISCRLGMLLAACALGTVSYLRSRKKEEKSWIIPSEA